MARLIYACRFDIASSGGVQKVAEEYGAWITTHYKNRYALTNFSIDPITGASVGELPEDHEIASNVFSSESGDAIRMRWSFPDGADSSLRWINDVRLGEFDNRCSVEHQIFIESVDYNIAPARLRVGSPWIIRNLCINRTAFIGDMQVRATPYALSADGLDKFLELLRSDLRKLPIVFLAPYSGGEPNLLDAARLASDLAGVAVVVETVDPDVTWDFAEAVGRQLSCFNGAARIYWPGYTDADEPRNHRLFLAARIEQAGPLPIGRAIAGTIFTVAAFRFVPDQRISAVIREVETAVRQERLEAQVGSRGENWEAYALELDAELEATKREIEDIRRENENLKANQKVLFTGTFAAEEGDDEVEDEVVSVESVSDALDQALNKARNLEVLPSAISAAIESPFQRPGDVYRALRDLDEIVDTWRGERNLNGSGGDLAQHLRNRGWGKRCSMHISSTTRGQYRSHYEFDYQGERKLFEPHITLGAGDFNNCASIHFIFDREREKMVVGHVGRHLPNTKT